MLSGYKANYLSEVEVVSPPDDSVSAIEFSPSTLQKNYLLAGSWDSSVRCWEVAQDGHTVPKSMKVMDGPILDVCWSNDGTKVFMASCDNKVQMWDLLSEQVIQVAAHDNAVKTCHTIETPKYSCIMTGSWDKTLKFWDTRSANPLKVIHLPDRCYCADVDYPLAVVVTANRDIIIYSLENGPEQQKLQKSSLKGEHRSVTIFKDDNKKPEGYALGSIEGRVSVQYINPRSNYQSFNFMCHRSDGAPGVVDIYAVNDVKSHPVHPSCATVGSDGKFNFWDIKTRTRLYSSTAKEQPITKCAFSSNGQLFAYGVGYDWSKGHEHFNPLKKPQIFIRACNQLKPLCI